MTLVNIVVPDAIIFVQELILWQHSQIIRVL